MTREEAIAILIREVADDPFVRTEYREQIHEALSMAIKALEQDDTVSFDFELYEAGLMNIPKEMIKVIDKIRAEIEENAYPIVHGVNNHELGMTLYGILQVIDKYKAESEGEK